jgi:polyisoprenoid-binding protein YceI
MYIMHLIVSFLILPVLTSMTMADKPMKPVDRGSEVKFTIRNFGLAVNGRFTGLEGNVTFDTGNLARSQIEMSIDASTINTGIAARDAHLKKKAYFDIKEHPRIKFRSLEIWRNDKSGNYTVRGELTIKSVKKEIIFPFDAIAQNDGFLFTASFSLNRKEFGVGGDSISLSDILTVSLQILTKQ